MSSRPSRVMIVDDHPLVRDAIRRAIASPELEIVAEAATAGEALSAAATANPDLILLDIDLPAASGIDLIPELLRLAPGTLIVMLTVSADEEDVHEAIRLGASGYLTKDLGSEALSRAIQGALAGDLAMTRRMAKRLLRRYASTAPPTEARSGIRDLSPREREILRLLAEGLTAREIGERLVLSTRTVEGHAGRVLRKLGVRNRIEAVQRYRGASGTT